MDVTQISPLVACEVPCLLRLSGQVWPCIERCAPAREALHLPARSSPQPDKKLASMSVFSNSMDISVVIVGWNARHYLELCLESLETAPPRRSIEILVVDNASTDGSAEMIETRFPWVKLIKSSENLGFAKGNNLAIRQCQGRYIALVNPDVIVFPGCLDALADFLDQNPKVGNVGPRVFEPDMSMQSTCRRFPTLWNNFCSSNRLGDEVQEFPLFCRRAHVLLFP